MLNNYEDLDRTLHNDLEYDRAMYLAKDKLAGAELETFEDVVLEVLDICEDIGLYLNGTVMEDLLNKFIALLEKQKGQTFLRINLQYSYFRGFYFD